MKPGRATLETMVEAIMSFEQSVRADRRRQVLYQLESMTQNLPAQPSRERIRHRELRRMARRLARLAEKEREKVLALEADQVLYLQRIQRLEREIDRLDPTGSGKPPAPTFSAPSE